MRRSLLFTLLIFLAAVSLSFVFATPQTPAQAQMSTMFERFFDLSTWLTGVQNTLRTLTGPITNIAIAIVLLGFAIAVLGAILGAGMAALQGALVRLGIIAVLLYLGSGVGDNWLNTPLANALTQTLQGVQRWSTQQVGAHLTRSADNLNTLAARVVPFAVGINALKSHAQRNAARPQTQPAVTPAQGGQTANPQPTAGQRPNERAAPGLARTMQYLTWATTLIIPLLLFYFIIMVVASFTIAVGLLIFPLVVAMLIFPKGAAADWFGKWVAAVVGALFIIILLPVVFGTAIDLGINRPVQEVNRQTDAAIQSIWDDPYIRAEGERLLRELGGDRGTGAQLLAVPQMAAFVANHADRVLQTVGHTIQMFFLGVLLMLAGMAAAAYVVFNVERVAMSFIGGFVAQGTRGLMGTSVVPGIGGGGSGRTFPTPPSSGGNSSPPGGQPPGLPSPTPRGPYDIQPAYGGGGPGGGGSAGPRSSRDDAITVEYWEVKPTPELGPGKTPPALGPGRS